MIIRRFQDNDLPQCIDIFVNSFRQDPWNEMWAYQTAQNYLVNSVASPGFVGIVACDNDRITGMLFGRKRQWWDGYEFHIEEMCVNPDVQGLGIGTKLLNYVMKNVVDTSTKRIKLWTHSSSLAYKFYENRGFMVVSSIVFMKKE